MWSNTFAAVPAKAEIPYNAVLVRDDRAAKPRDNYSLSRLENRTMVLR